MTRLPLGKPPAWLFQGDRCGEDRRVAIARLYGYFRTATLLGSELVRYLLVELVDKRLNKPPLGWEEVHSICDDFDRREGLSSTDWGEPP